MAVQQATQCLCSRLHALTLRQRARKHLIMASFRARGGQERKGIGGHSDVELVYGSAYLFQLLALQLNCWKSRVEWLTVTTSLSLITPSISAILTTIRILEAVL